MQPIDSIEIYAYGTIKGLVSVKEEIKCNNIIKRDKESFDDVTKENMKEQYPNWPEIPDHPYSIWIVGDSWFGKTNSLFNLKS